MILYLYILQNHFFLKHSKVTPLLRSHCGSLLFLTSRLDYDWLPGSPQSSVVLPIHFLADIIYRIQISYFYILAGIIYRKQTSHFYICTLLH